MVSDSFTIPEFCRIAGISRQRLYIFWKQDRGPPFVSRKIGNRTERLIAMAPGLEWLRLHYPARHAVYSAMLDGFHDIGLDTSPCPAKPWVKPLTAAKFCITCGKVIRPTRKFCSYICKAMHERGGK
ncbi:hypothetical protein ABIE76_003102 [Sinorhizobium fredii]